MREIKFRALNSYNEFIYGLPYTDGTNDTLYFKEYSNRLCWRGENGKHCNQPYKNGTLNQYTGLKDKNGKEIYEGDIYITDNDVEDFYQVFYLNGAFCGGKNINNCMPIAWTSNKNDYNDLISDNWFETSLEVVGNIYENPELLDEIK